MAELLLQLIGFAMELLLVATGRILVCAASAGHWRGEREDEGRIHSTAGALSFWLEGRRVITHTGTLLVGLAFYALVIAILVSRAAQP